MGHVALHLLLGMDPLWFENQLKLVGWWPPAHTWLDLELHINSPPDTFRSLFGLRIDMKYICQICSILNLQGNKIWPIWAGSRCQVPPGWVVATFPHLIGPWVVQNSPLDPVSGWELTENGMKLVRFAQFWTCRGTRFGLFGQVPGARCHLVGWWPPSHTWLDLRLWKIPPPDPFGAHCGVKIAPKLEGKNSQKCNSKYLDEFTWTQGGFLGSNLMI